MRQLHNPAIANLGFFFTGDIRGRGRRA